MKKDIAEHIHDIMDEKKYAEYAGGTLCFRDDENRLVMLCVDGFGSIDGVSYEQSKEERRLTCQSYLRYKTPDHTLYSAAKEFLDEPR